MFRSPRFGNHIVQRFEVMRSMALLRRGWVRTGFPGSVLVGPGFGRGGWRFLGGVRVLFLGVLQPELEGIGLQHLVVFVIDKTTVAGQHQQVVRTIPAAHEPIIPERMVVHFLGSLVQHIDVSRSPGVDLLEFLAFRIVLVWRGLLLLHLQFPSVNDIAILGRSHHGVALQSRGPRDRVMEQVNTVRLQVLRIRGQSHLGPGRMDGFDFHALFGRILLRMRWVRRPGVVLLGSGLRLVPQADDQPLAEELILGQTRLGHAAPGAGGGGVRVTMTFWGERAGWLGSLSGTSNSGHVILLCPCRSRTETCPAS